MQRQKKQLCLLLSALLLSPLVQADTEFAIDIVWDNQYITEGRDNLDKGGIAWAVASVNQDDLVVYAALGRGDQTHYIEWNFGLEYLISLHDDVEASIGYQRLEFYGDERGSDNELFASISYSGVTWLIPSLYYTYATEASGYFVEVQLQSPWDITENLAVTPYVSQGFDFGYATEQYDGANHFQFGIEASYQISEAIVIAAHLSHSIAMGDIKQQAKDEAMTGNLDQTFAGVHLNWRF
ncbi:hypothetical protein [Shewanella aestuarii]|uniref:MipA/OmpV family protein n=1 Tax=Shewanella aestuarii TaxID=1028752 RepID=A0A6G9QMX3_9GAMM|nr:hypothetical protein [Shewanella aestuarii]QIR15934.1 hypothetical protein HBH39_16850 [Shewanella aestuarii]